MKIKIIFFLPLLMLLLTLSCSTKHNAVTAEHIKMQYVSGYLRDSIFLYDSVRVREKADTVFVTRTRTLYRDRVRADTLWLRDTLLRVETITAHTSDRKSISWSSVTLIFLLFLLLCRSGLLSLVRFVIEKITKAK